jgi:hypothetical protein
MRMDEAPEARGKRMSARCWGEGGSGSRVVATEGYGTAAGSYITLCPAIPFTRKGI